MTVCDGQVGTFRTCGGGLSQCCNAQRSSSEVLVTTAGSDPFQRIHSITVDSCKQDYTGRPAWRGFPSWTDRFTRVAQSSPARGDNHTDLWLFKLGRRSHAREASHKSGVLSRHSQRPQFWGLISGIVSGYPCLLLWFVRCPNKPCERNRAREKLTRRNRDVIYKNRELSRADVRGLGRRTSRL